VPALAGEEEGREGALDLLPLEWEVLALIDGERDLREIAGALGRSEFDVAKIVFGLRSSEVVTLSDPRAEAAAAEPAPGADDALAEIERLLEAGDLDAASLEAEALVVAHPNDPAVHLTAARVHLAAKRPRDAEGAARRALGLDPLLATAHQLLGDALVGQGRFAEGVSWWDRWLTLERHGPRDPDEEARVRSATAAARTLDQFMRERHGG
jgi:tetratricopeptide (TPR) repeat protein